MDRLKAILFALNGDRDRLVIDLSCRRVEERWFVAMNKWQTITDMEVNKGRYSLPRKMTFLISFLQKPSSYLSHTARNF